MTLELSWVQTPLDPAEESTSSSIGLASSPPPSTVTPAAEDLRICLTALPRVPVLMASPPPPDSTSTSGGCRWTSAAAAAAAAAVTCSFASSKSAALDPFPTMVAVVAALAFLMMMGAEEESLSGDDDAAEAMASACSAYLAARLAEWEASARRFRHSRTNATELGWSRKKKKKTLLLFSP